MNERRPGGGFYAAIKLTRYTPPKEIIQKLVSAPFQSVVYLDPCLLFYWDCLAHIRANEVFLVMTTVTQRSFSEIAPGELGFCVPVDGHSGWNGFQVEKWNSAAAIVTAAVNGIYDIFANLHTSPRKRESCRKRLNILRLYRALGYFGMTGKTADGLRDPCTNDEGGEDS